MFSFAVLASMVIRGLYESQALFNNVNRSFDGLVTGKTATSIDIPKNPQLVVSTAAVAKDSANRKKAKADTTMVNVPFLTYTVPLKEEIEARMETNGKLIDNFIMDAVEAYSDKFDAAVIAEAQTTDQEIEWDGDNLTWKDIIAINQKFNVNKVPRRDRLVVVPASLETDFKSIDVVKSAMAFNQNLLEGGVFIINGMRFYISSYVEQVGGKDNLVGIYGPGLAFVLKEYMVRKEAYDPATRDTDIDFNSFAAKKLLRNEYAVLSKKP